MWSLLFCDEILPDYISDIPSLPLSTRIQWQNDIFAIWARDRILTVEIRFSSFCQPFAYGHRKIVEISCQSAHQFNRGTDSPANLDIPLLGILCHISFSETFNISLELENPASLDQIFDRSIIKPSFQIVQVAWDYEPRTVSISWIWSCASSLRQWILFTYCKNISGL